VLPSEVYAAIEEIIFTLPNNAHTFDQICTRYKAVMAERELDLGVDEETYASLLKLGMQRGATWKEKWSNAQKATPGITHPLPSLDILKARLDSLDPNPPRSHLPELKTPRLQPKRPPDPPLHFANEDYEERPRKTPEQRKYRNAADPMTSTPQRLRSLPIHYLETPSTAHPIKQRVTFLSPTRSAFESNESFNPPPSLSSGESEAETASPSSRYRPNAEDQRILPDQRIVQAEQFRSYTLLSTCLDHWRMQTDNRQAIELRTSLVRDRILVKRALAVWKLKLRLVEEVMVPKAEVWSEVVLMRKALRTWVALVKHKRRRRWELEMREALEVVNARTCGRLMGNVWQVRQM